MLASIPVPFAFIHIPKTGGTSVEQALVRGVLGREGFQNLSREEATRFALPGGERVEPPGGDDCERSRDCGGFRRVAPQAIQHESVAYFERCGLLEDRLVFTVVRNPFARALSEIFYQRVNDPECGRMFRGPRWKDDLLTYAGFDGCLGHDLGACQVDWLVESKGRLRADRILRQESLDGDWLALCQETGLPHVPLPRELVSPRSGHWSEYYDEESAERIARKYARDFEAFGYSTDISSYRAEAPRGFRGLMARAGEASVPGWIAGNRHFQMGRHLVPDASLDAVCVPVLDAHTPGQAVVFLAECRRMLRPGGVLRVMVRDLAVLVRLLAEGEDAMRDGYVNWYLDTYLPEAPFAAPAFVANGWLRQDGVAYFYDEGLLLEVLHEAGFGQAVRMPPGTGSRPELCGLEPDQINGTFHPFDRLIVEAVNPA